MLVFFSVAHIFRLLIFGILSILLVFPMVGWGQGDSLKVAKTMIASADEDAAKVVVRGFF